MYNLLGLAPFPTIKSSAPVAWVDGLRSVWFVGNNAAEKAVVIAANLLYDFYTESLANAGYLVPR